VAVIKIFKIYQGMKKYFYEDINSGPSLITASFFLSRTMKISIEKFFKDG